MANDPLRDKLDQAADRADAASTAFYAVLTNNKETPVPVEGGTVDSMSKRIYDQVGAQIDAINAKADEAAASATSANASKNAAANSVTQANAAKAAAEGARDTAVQAKDQAQTAAQASQASAVSAQSSASNSSNSANQAANSANTASTAVNQAVQAKDAANVAKNAAQASATSAEASKNAAANSATSAQTGATNSQGYSQSALNYRNAAEGFKNEAKASETAAAASAASALDSKNSALQSKTDSQSAASTATNAAANASASASSAASSENVASNAASSALVSKTAAEEVYRNLTEYEGTVNGDESWSDIPAHKDAALNTQAKSIADRTLLIRANQTKTPLLYATYDDVVADISKLPQGQLVDVESTKRRYRVNSGTLVFVRPTVRFVSIQDFGAKQGNTPIQNYTAIQAALDSGAPCVFVPPDMAYEVNQEPLVPAGVTLYGLPGSKIIQTVYGLSGCQLRGKGAKVFGIEFVNPNVKTQLSQSVQNRYNGEVARSRCSAVYVFAPNCVAKDIIATNFINGVNLINSDRVWSQTTGAFTSTTLQLNEADRKPDGYYVGYNIRIFSRPASSATETIPVTWYDSTTNTVSFPAQTEFIGPFYYLMNGSMDKGNIVMNLRGSKLDFGVLGKYQDDFQIDDLWMDSIEQTQETNARPHTVYITEPCKNLRGARWRTSSCPMGNAYKLRTVDGFVLDDLSAKDSRSVLAIESCKQGRVTNVDGFSIGALTNEFRPHSLNVADSEDILVNRVTMRISPNFQYGGDSSKRPTAILFDGDEFAANKNVVINEVDTDLRGADQAFAFLSTTPTSGLHTNCRIKSITTFGNGSYSGGVTVPYIARPFSTDGLRIDSVTHFGTDSARILFEPSSSNSVVRYFTSDASIIVTNNGTNNRIIANGEETIDFTPTIGGNSVPGTFTYSIQRGVAIKRGSIVTARVRIEWTSKTGTTSGEPTIFGLPFAAVAGGTSTSTQVTESPASIPGAFSGITFEAGSFPICVAPPGTSAQIRVRSMSNTGVTSLNSSAIGASGSLQLTLTYQTNP